MSVADFVVSDSIRRASTFERYRGGKVYDLHRRPFRFSQGYFRSAKGEVRCGINLSGGPSCS
jgi:hypothetical protein